MVGVKTWADDQIALILVGKAQGKKVSEIIIELKKQWPRGKFKDSGVRYVMTNYKEFPRNQSMAGSSNPRSSQGSGRGSQKRAHPKETKPAKSSSSRSAPQTAKLRTNQSQFQSPPTAPPSPQMQYAAGMREISGGPIAATFNDPQPFKAQDIGIDAIEIGQKAPPPPADPPVMASPASQRPATIPQMHPTPVGEFGQHGMQRTMSMPPIHGLPTQFGGMAQPDMRMGGQQHLQMNTIYFPPRTPHVRGHNTQIRGNSQHMGLHHGQFNGMDLNMNVNMGGMAGGNMVMDMGPPFGYNPNFGQMQPPSTPQRAYHLGPLNYGPAGPTGGMMPGQVPFNELAHPGQVTNLFNNGQYHPPPSPMRRTNPVNNGQYRPAPSPMQRTNPAMPKFDPSLDPRLFNTNPFMFAQSVDQRGAPFLSNKGRPSAQSGTVHAPRQNHLAKSAVQGTPNSSATPPRPNALPNTTVPEPRNGTSATLGQSRPAISNAQEIPGGTTAAYQLNARPKSATQELQNELAASLQSSLPGNTAGSGTAKTIIVLDGPKFDLPFTYPSSNEGWNVLLREHSKVTGKHHPAELHSVVSKGNFELRIVNPTFHRGFVWGNGPEISVEPNGQTESSPESVKTNLTASKQTDGLDLVPSPCSSTLTSDVSETPIAKKAPVTGPVQIEQTQDPKTPSTRVSPSLANQETPSVSNLRLNRSDEESPASARMSVPGPSIGTRNPDVVAEQVSKSPPQLLECHSMKTHNRQSGKRSAPTTEEELLPSKRHKGFDQNAQALGEASRSLSTTEMSTNNGNKMTSLGTQDRPDYSQSMCNPVEHGEFAAAVNRIPAPNQSQLSLPAGDRFVRQIQAHNYVPAQPFNPRPSQPLNNIEPFRAESLQQARIQELAQTQHPVQTPQEYSAVMAKVAGGIMPRHPFVAPPDARGIVASSIPFQQAQIQSPLPTQKPQQQQQQEYSLPDFLADTANGQQPLQEYQDFDFGENDNSEWDQFMIGNMDMNVDAAPRPFPSSSRNATPNPTSSQSHTPAQRFSPLPVFALHTTSIDDLFDEGAQDAASCLVPSGDPNPNPLSASNSKSNSAASHSHPQSSPIFINNIDDPNFHAIFGEHNSSALPPGPFRSASNASPHMQSAFEFQARGGDFADILDHQGVHDPARHGNGGVGTGLNTAV